MGAEKPKLEKIRTILRQRTALFRLLQEARAYIDIRLKGNPTLPSFKSETIFANVYPLEMEKAWDKYKKLLQKMSTFLKERQIKLLLAIFPMFEQIKNSHLNKPQSILREFSRANNIPFLDLLPIFRENGTGKTLYLMNFGDGHPGKKAYQLAANQIYLKLIAEGLLD